MPPFRSPRSPSPPSSWSCGRSPTCRRGRPAGANAWVTVEYPCLLLVALLLGLNRRTHRVRADQAAALLAKSERLREEQAAVAALEERARIAREIHDVLA